VVVLEQSSGMVDNSKERLVGDVEMKWRCKGSKCEVPIECQAEWR